ncbi:hypothetical protein JQ625_06860 [Bradyrhizobium diazoefficiens]|nr:hypothetical protein [Bradyrhizobium diazoefficiens]MBR0774547.1 hypothetical protein [Bradyrhizobium diazoefficiens]
MKIVGANYWIKSAVRVRQFTVAEPDDQKARELIRLRVPDAEFLSRTDLESAFWSFST